VLHFFIVFGNRSPHRAVNTGRTTAADCGTQKGAEAVGVVKRERMRARGVDHINTLNIFRKDNRRLHGARERR
jgi:hypothetical protein